ncbi:hypothetical protein F751_0633 [Auxenochlorella protothecoides]|uniref:Uncharacterized protein n=2 Tax=Auxenochlorella protothecoides TaxID=3075 RepID=A0A087SQE3_AUXPR|nr:hypothetical protein F751_0633 [Auxenochlorella protothecoides]KFM27947.1 hypothetical protein F751_0633 [Auxenochlorella protothecoides]
MRALLHLPAVFLALVLFLQSSIVVQADCDPRIGFFSLPTVLLKGYESHAFLFTEVVSRSYPFPNAEISTLDIDSWDVCVPCDRYDCSCTYIRIIECLPEGVERCESWYTPFWATIGTGNNGFNNYGNYNLGDDNEGNGNIGNSNVGNNNTGESIICNNKRGDSPFASLVYLLDPKSAVTFCR